MLYKLDSNRTANQAGKLCPAKRKILFDLYNTQCISSTFCLDRKDIARSPPIYANIDFIGFYLADPRHGGSQMILEGIASHAGKYIDQAIIPELCQKRLLITQRILCNHSWRGVRYFDFSQ